MRSLLLALAFLIATPAWGYNLNLGIRDGSFLDVDESYVEWRKYETWRNTNTPEKEDWDWTAEWHTTLSLWKRFYWDTNYHMSMDSSQIRWVGLEYYMGLRIMPWLHAVKYHHSEHCADMNCGRFPVEDSYGVRVYFKTLDVKARK